MRANKIAAGEPVLQLGYPAGKLNAGIPLVKYGGLVQHLQVENVLVPARNGAALRLHHEGAHALLVFGNYRLYLPHTEVVRLAFKHIPVGVHRITVDGKFRVAGEEHKQNIFVLPAYPFGSFKPVHAVHFYVENYYIEQPGRIPRKQLLAAPERGYLKLI